MSDAPIIFNGSQMSLSEAVARLMRELIETETVNVEDFNPNWNPYQYWALELGKNEGTIRKWVADPDREGKTPTLLAFFHLIHKTKSPAALEFIQNLVLDNPKKQTVHQMKIFQKLTESLERFTAEVRSLCAQYHEVINQLDFEDADRTSF